MSNCDPANTPPWALMAMVFDSTDGPAGQRAGAAIRAFADALVPDASPPDPMQAHSRHHWNHLNEEHDFRMKVRALLLRQAISAEANP